MTNNNLKINLEALDLSVTAGGTYRVNIGTGFVKEVGNNYSKSPAVTATSFVATVPLTTFVTYTNPLKLNIDNFPNGIYDYRLPITTGTTAQGLACESVVLSFDKKIYKNTGNFYVSKNGTTISTIPVSDSSISITNTNTIHEATLNILNSSTYVAGESYKITWDSGILKDLSFNLPVAGVTTSDTPIYFTLPSGISVTGSTPSLGETNVSSIGSLHINLSDITRQSSGQFTLKRADGTLIKTWLNNTVAVDTSTGVSTTLGFPLDLTELSPSTTYYVNAPYNALAPIGYVPINGYFEINNTSTVKFTTIAEIPAPNINSVVPVYNTTNYTGTGVISLVFDKPTSAGLGNVYIYKQGLSTSTGQITSTGALTYSTTGTTTTATISVSGLSTSTTYILSTDAQAFVSTNKYYNTPQYSGITNTSTVKFTTVPQLTISSYSLPSSGSPNSLSLTFNTDVYRTGTGQGLQIQGLVGGIGSSGDGTIKNFLYTDESRPSSSTISFDTTSFPWVSGKMYVLIFSSISPYNNGLTSLPNSYPPIYFTYS